jgi:hypothetical protein
VADELPDLTADLGIIPARVALPGSLAELPLLEVRHSQEPRYRMVEPPKRLPYYSELVAQA